MFETSLLSLNSERGKKERYKKKIENYWKHHLGREEKPDERRKDPPPCVVNDDDGLTL